jgi:tRNA-(ms[2]io[6]A)-hydroxylase
MSRRVFCQVLLNELVSHHAQVIVGAEIDVCIGQHQLPEGILLFTFVEFFEQKIVVHRGKIRTSYFIPPTSYICAAMEPVNEPKNILGLHLPTDPRWVNLAEKSLEEILTDHAYCEQKAATSCISLIQRYSDKEKLVNELAPIVTEEWGHFRLVLAELQKRDLKLGKQRKDAYVNELLKFEIKGGSVEDRFLDKLLIFALIEARSCERFKRLSEGLDDEYLRSFYRRFMESEAGHYHLFIELAETYVDKSKVRRRWQEWLTYEAAVMKSLDVRGDRIH